MWPLTCLDTLWLPNWDEMWTDGLQRGRVSENQRQLFISGSDSRSEMNCHQIDGASLETFRGANQKHKPHAEIQARLILPRGKRLRQ